MKSFLKVLCLMALFSGSLLQGYAIVFDKSSPEPYVDIYVYKVNSVEEANKKHANYQRLLRLPNTVIDVLEKGKGASEAIALALAAPTEGTSVAVQKGLYTVVGAGKAGIKMFDKPIAQGLGRLFRQDDHAFHENVWRGNRGRDAEWKTDKTMYAIVTLHNNLLQLHQPVRLPTGGRTGFTLVPTGNKDLPYTVQFSSNYANQYIPAEDDKRDKKEAKKLAKESGEYAYQGKK